MRFGRQLSEEDLYELKVGDRVLVVNTNDEYEPFMGIVGWVDNNLNGLYLAIIDVNMPKDHVRFNDENIMVFMVERWGGYDWFR